MRMTRLFRCASFAFAATLVSTALMSVAAADMPEVPSPAGDAAAASAPALADKPAASTFDEAFLAAEDNIKSGETTFYQNCAYCHGSKGSGGKAKPLQCRKRLDSDYVFETITNGRQSGSLIMPPWKDSMSDEVRWQLTSYIMSLKTLPECKKP